MNIPDRGTGELNVEAAEYGSPKQYPNEVGRVAILTAAQETELAKRMEVGRYAEYLLEDTPEYSGATAEELEWLARDGKDAKKHMVEANTGLVGKAARQEAWRCQNLQFDDLVQEGIITLIETIDKFDYKRGNKFSTFAMWPIRREILRAIGNYDRLVRMPVHVVEQFYKARGTRNRLWSELGRQPAFEEIAVELRMTADEVQELLGNGRRPVSLNRLMSDSATELEDFLPGTIMDPYEGIERIAKIQEIRNLLEAKLDLREQEIVALRFGFYDDTPLTLKEIGEKYGISKERVRQIVREATEKIQRAIEDHEAREELLELIA